MIGECPSEAVFLLAEPGTKTYFRERVRVPVDADNDLIGVTLDRNARREPDVLDTVARELQLVEQEVS